MRINPAAMIVAAMAICTVALVTPMLLAGHATAQPPAASGAPESGEALYKANCSACHQVNGKGIAGAFPSLIGSPVVDGPDAGYLALVLNGRGGMPAFKPELDDATLASAMTYVRGAWSNKGAPITAAAVATARGSDTPYTPPPTLQAH